MVQVEVYYKGIKKEKLTIETQARMRKIPYLEFYSDGFKKLNDHIPVLREAGSLSNGSSLPYLSSS